VSVPVILLTPPMTHRDLVLRCAAAGKHVLLEKPLDYTAERARQSIDAMQKADRRFGVVLQHRFRTASRKLIAIAGSGELGELISASASIRWWRTPEYFAEPGRGMKARDGGGVLITQAIHTLDLFQSLAGPIARVAAMARTSPQRTIDTEDMVAAAISFRSGAIGHHRRHHGCLSGLSGEDRTGLRKRHRGARGRDPHGALP